MKRMAADGFTGDVWNCRKWQNAKKGDPLDRLVLLINNRQASATWSPTGPAR
jgi:hypothetical protein